MNLKNVNTKLTAQTTLYNMIQGPFWLYYNILIMNNNHVVQKTKDLHLLYKPLPLSQANDIALTKNTLG